MSTGRLHLHVLVHKHHTWSVLCMVLVCHRCHACSVDMVAKARATAACAGIIALCICLLTVTVAGWQDIPRASRAGAVMPSPLGMRSGSTINNSTLVSTLPAPPAVTRVSHAPGSTPSNHSEQWRRGKTPYLVCTSPWAPLVRWGAGRDGMQTTMGQSALP